MLYARAVHPVTSDVASEYSPGPYHSPMKVLMTRSLALLCALAAVSTPALAQEAPPSAIDGPTKLNELLRAAVRGGGVDYRALRARLPELVAAHEWYGAHGPRSAPAEFSGSNARLAYWLNAYNATVLRGVAEAPASMRNVLTYLPNNGFFRGRRWRIDGRQMTLDEIENQQIRPVFRDARVHFALNCAARSCPPLRNEAYTASRVNAQLDAQARRYLNASGRVEVNADAHTVRAVQLFEWFSADFIASAPPRARGVAGSVPGFIYAFAAPPLRASLEAACGADLTGCTMQSAPYDWSLNEAR